MNQKLKYAIGAIGATAVLLAAQASAQITLYEGEGFSGRQLATDQRIGNLERDGFNGGALSVVVGQGRWEICEDARFEGRCVILSPGNYESLRSLGMNSRVSSVRPVDEGRRHAGEIAAPAAAPVVTAVMVPAPVPQATAPITFYEGEGFRGRMFATDRQVGNFERFGFSDQSSSVIVLNGRWEVCEHPRFEGRCVILRPGSYDSLRGLGMENRISSARPADERQHYNNERRAPPEAPNYEYRQHAREQVALIAPAPAPRFERITLSAKELFAFDSAALRMPQPKIDKIADVLVRFPQITDLHISGFTDRLGSDRYNKKLSQRRADAVKAYLVRKGIDSSRMIAQGEGESNPVVQCSQSKRTELIECLEPNRRIEIEQITIERRAR